MHLFAKAIQYSELSKSRKLSLLMQYILQNPPQTQAEHQIKTGLVAHLERGESGFCSIAQYCFTSCGKESFQNFINSQREYMHRFPAIAFQIMSNEYFFYLFALCELRERKIETISRVWKYNWYELRTLSSRDFMQQIDVIFSEWMSNLPELYSQCYKKLFRDDKYRFTGRYLFRNKDTRYSETMSRVTSVVHHYSASQLEICYDQNICEEFSDENRAKGLKSIHKGLIFDAFLDRKLMFCDAIACLLYQGICQGLGYQPVPLHMGAHIHGRGLSLFI